MAAVLNGIVAILASLTKIFQMVGEVYRETVIRKTVLNEIRVHTLENKIAADEIDKLPVINDKQHILDRM